MKQPAIQYLALDVHQATCVATVRDERGAIVMRATVATETRAILQLVKNAGPLQRQVRRHRAGKLDFHYDISSKNVLVFGCGRPDSLGFKWLKSVGDDTNGKRNR